jgi:hypothetical protein
VIRSLLRVLHVDPYENLLSDKTMERFGKSLSPRFLANKLAVTLYERRHPEHPWITRDAIERLESYLERQHLGFEWGSGPGSIWFARRIQRLVSVEHNARWADRVRPKLVAEAAERVDYRLVPEREYLAAIDDFPDEYFDFILVDGLFRDAALLRSMKKVKRSGWIVFDNANWYLPSSSPTPHSRSFADGPATELLAQAWNGLSSWKTHWTSNGVNDTAIFIRP